MILNYIENKIAEGCRLTEEDALTLFHCDNVSYVGKLANSVRENLHGDATFFNQNIHLNLTNICVADCNFCSYSCQDQNASTAYLMSQDDVIDWIDNRITDRTSEVHIVNGLHPTLPLEFYLSIIKEITKRYPQLTIKAFTAVEIHHFSLLSSSSYQDILSRIRDAGVASLPGGGAEVLVPRVRKILCPNKVNSKGWLNVHHTAHLMGLTSNCTMLVGSIETLEERVEHLRQLRMLQDETGGFQAFIPLAYHPKGNRLTIEHSPDENDLLRTIAVSRLYLDNIKHIKSYWVSLGITTAQKAQLFGADDIDGTIAEEKIYHSSGSLAPNHLDEKTLCNIIKDIGREPVERNTYYNVVKKQ